MNRLSIHRLTDKSTVDLSGHGRLRINVERADFSEAFFASRILERVIFPVSAEAILPEWTG